MNTIKTEIEIPTETIEELKRYTLDSILLDDEIPKDIKRAITQAIAKHIESSPEWEKIALEIVKEVESRKSEIIKSIADRMVSQISKGINHAASQVIQQLSSKLSNTRF